MRVTTPSEARAYTAKKRKVLVTDPGSAQSHKQKQASKRVTKKSYSTAVVVPAEGKGKEPAVPIVDTAKAVRDFPPLPRTFKIIAGSYEKLLYGLEASFEDDEQGSPTQQLRLNPVFIFPAHVSCVKAVAASPSGGKWLATGSSDEIIKVWDLRRRKEIGGLIHHEGSITYLTFPSRSHLLSASEDGTLCLFRARDWAVLRTLKGHKGRVNCVGVHPSGKLALSIGNDRTLRMWDLMRGKGSASTKLGKEGEKVCWSPSGSRFAVQAGSSIDLFSTGMALLHTVTHPSRIQDVKFFRPKDIKEQLEFLLVAAEDKKVTIYELSPNNDIPPKPIAELVGHTNRVKALDLISVAIPPYSEGKATTYVSTVSSDGYIRVFNLDEVLRGLSAHVTEQPAIIEPVAEYDTKGSRLTCVAMGDGEIVVDSQQFTGGKRKRNEVVVDGVDDWPSEEEEAASEEEGEAQTATENSD